MVTNIEDIITDGSILAERCVLRDGFVFTTVTYPANVYDAIVIKYPRNIHCSSPNLRASTRSLKDHIDFIQSNKIDKALIIAENIDFITACPTLKHLHIVPADSAGNNFDYSPLYRMPQIKSLSCSTIYGLRDEFSTSIDFAQINGLECVSAANGRQQNFNTVKTLKSLSLSGYKRQDLSDAFDSSILDTLTVIQSKIKSLDGIQKSQKMQCLYLYYNRSLRDIGPLLHVKQTLRALRIENCPKIEDFSVLGQLENLELLELYGSNELPSLGFFKTMKKLKTFVFNINVLDGNLLPCLDLSYVYSERNRKHYNLKDCDLPKGEYARGNNTIETWRRLE